MLHKKNTSLRKIIDTLEGAGRIIIVTHKGPDGDAVGSSLALGMLLRNLGKTVEIAVNAADIGTPRVLRGIDTLTPPDKTMASPDLLVCLDCADEKRISYAPFQEKTKIWRTLNIDHHDSSSCFGDFHYVLPEFSSTGEIILKIARAAKWNVTNEIADAIWTAIVTDSGRFSYSCTSAATLQAGAYLLAHGADYVRLNDALFFQIPPNLMELRKIAMKSLRLWCGGKVSVIALDEADYAATNCTKADTEDFVDIPRSVTGTVISVFFYRSFKGDSTHMSIRSRTGYSAQEIAKHFGGGGHIVAAGATVPDTLATAMANAEKYLNGYLDSLAKQA